MGEPRVTQAHSTFSMTSAVTIDIAASPETLWSILTDAQGFPKWNSTVTSIEGRIADGERLVVHAPGTAQTFKPKISDFVATRRMTWTGGTAGMFKGVRTFELTPHDDGMTEFAMKETFAGLMLPMIKGQLPDFGPVFAQYANDLQAEAARRG